MSAEIKKVVQETLVGKPEEQVQTIEKCLRLVGSNRTPKEQELGYCLLARMVIKCTAPNLRAVQSRLANRFAQISDHFQLCGALFVREVLVKIPTAGDLHAAIVTKIILNCIDAAVESKDPTIRGLAAELFALRVNSQNLTVLMSTLDALLSDKKVGSSPEILELSTIGVTSFRSSLTSLLFEILALSLGYATKPGISIDRKTIIRIIELGLKKSETRRFAFACLRSVCVNAKCSMIPMIPRIVSTLISELDSPDVELIRTLSFISKCFGPVTSTLHRHFYVIFTALKHPLHEQSYGEHAATLLASIIESSAGLIKPEVFVTVQKAVCESAIIHPECSEYQELLAAFLSLNNEFVPSPLHIARAIVARSRSTSEVAHRLRALCEVASRPRCSDVSNVKTAKKTLILKEEKVIQNEEKEPEEHQEDPDIMIVEEQEKEPVELIEPVELTEPEPESSRKKKSSENGAPIVKKKKKVAREVKTDLLEGEASVDDILNLFDPS